MDSTRLVIVSQIPFNRPFTSGSELQYITEAIESRELAGSRHFGTACERWLEDRTSGRAGMLTPSGTAALEFAALIGQITLGDEVILPSFTFPSTATAFVLRGATPVFVDIRADTLNIDETLVEQAITSKTKALVAVHYAGVSANLFPLRDLCAKYGLLLIEDAAQALGSSYYGFPIGSVGDCVAFSFHETKNFICGEGGALVLNQSSSIKRAEIIREKGTDRSRFFRGEVDKYTWQDIGSSFLLGELSAAFLWAQFQAADEILAERSIIWEQYHASFEDLESSGYVRRPIVPEECDHNAHLYYLLLPDEVSRDRLIEHLRSRGIMSLFHYLPLHSSRAGQRFGRSVGEMSVTDASSQRLLRLPLWIGMDESQIDRVVTAVYEGLT